MFRLFSRGDRKSKAGKQPEDDVDEQEQALQLWWWSESAVGQQLREGWRGVKPESADAGSLHYEKQEARRFRKEFASHRWGPTGRDVALPHSLLAFLCSSLAASVEALSSSDSSRPPAASETPFDGLLDTLTCVKLALQSTYNVRWMVERGALLQELAKLVEVVVDGLWPLCSAVMYLEGSQSDGDKAGRAEKIRQVCQRMEVYAAITVAAWGVFEVVPSAPDENMSASRIPLPPEEAARLCVEGASRTPSLAKTLSWALKMYWAHVVGAMARVGDGASVMFESILTTVRVLHFIIRPAKEGAAPADRLPGSKRLLSADVHVGLVECLRWPADMVFTKANGDALQEADVDRIAEEGFAPNDFHSPEIPTERALQYSECQLAALAVLASLVEDYPRYLVHLVNADMLAACGEVALWHTLRFATAEGKRGTAQRLREGGLVAEEYLRLPAPGTAAADRAYHRSDGDIEVDEPLLLAPCRNLLEALAPQEGRLKTVFDRLQQLSAAAQSVKRLRRTAGMHVQKHTRDAAELWTPDEGPGGEKLWECADRLEALALMAFSSHPSAQAAHPSTTAPHVQLALLCQRERYHMQLFALATVLQRLEQVTRPRGKSLPPGGEDVRHRKEEKRNEKKDAPPHSLFAALNLHAVFLASDFFYMAAFASPRQRNLAEPLPYRWGDDAADADPDAAADRCLRTFLTQASRHVLHALVAQASRKDLALHAGAALRQMARLRYTPVAVLHLSGFLLAACRRRDPKTTLYIAPCLARDAHLAAGLVDALVAAFGAQHRLSGGEKEADAPSELPVLHIDPAVSEGDVSDGTPSPGLLGADAGAPVKRSASYRALKKLTAIPSSAVSAVGVLARGKRGDRGADAGRADERTDAEPLPRSPLAVHGAPSALYNVAAADWSAVPTELAYAARNMVLEVLETVVVLPPVQLQLLARPAPAGFGGCRNMSVLWACFQDPELRAFAFKQTSYIIRHAGRGLDYEGLSNALRPAVNELISTLNWSSGAVVVSILRLLQSVLETLDQEEMKVMTQVGAERPAHSDPRRRKRAIQHLDRDCYLKIVATLNTNLDGAGGPSLHELRTQVIDTLAWLLRGNVRAKEQFKHEIGWGHVGETVLDCTGGEPEERIFDHLFKALLDAEGTHIENEEVLHLIHKLCYQPKFAQNKDLVLSLTDRLKSALTSSTHNLERASRAGVLTSLVDMIVFWEDEGIREHLIESYNRVGRHNITVKQLKPLFTTLRDQPGRKRLLLWFMRLLRNLAETRAAPSGSEGGSKERPSAVPPAFFNFSAGVHSGLKLPDVAAYPSSSGYSISTWLRIEGFVPPFFSGADYALSVEQNFQQYLYSLVAEGDNSVGFSAYFTHKQERGTLHLAVATGDGESRVAVDTFQFLPGRWYHFCLSHTAKRMISKSEAKLFINGEEVWKGGLRYPRSNVRYSAVVGSTLDGFKGQTLLHNFYGQLSAIYLIDNALSSSAVRAIYDLGPTYMSNVITHDKLHKLKYDIKIYMLFNPLAAQDDMLVNVANLDHMDEIAGARHSDGGLAVIGKGTQLCQHHALHEVLESLGGIDVLFPLLAMLSDHGAPLISGDACGEALQWSNVMVVPYLVSCLVTLFNDLLESQPEAFIRRVESGRLFHVLNHLLRPIAALLDKRTVACISQLLWNVGAMERRLPAYLASKVNEAWKDGFLFLFLDLAIWVQTSPAVQKELFSTICSVCRDDSVKRRLRQFAPLDIILDQMMWFLFYEPQSHQSPRRTGGAPPSPGLPQSPQAVAAAAFRDRDLRDRMAGKSGLASEKDVRAVRVEALEFVQLLMQGRCAEEDVLLLLSSIASPHQDWQQCTDLLELLFGLIDMRKEHFVDLLLKNGGDALLLAIVGSPRAAALRCAALACLGIALRYSKRLRDTFAVSTPYGMKALTDALQPYPLDVGTYKVLREMMFDTLRCPQKGFAATHAAPCKPLASLGGKYAVQYTAALPVIWALIGGAAAGAALAVKQLVAQDLLYLYEFEAAAVTAERMGWSQYAVKALVQVQREAHECTDPPALVQKHVTDVIDCTVAVLYHSLREEKGWQAADRAISILDHHQGQVHSYEVLQAIFTRLVGRVNADLQKGPLPPPPSPVAANLVYVMFFVEDLLCFNGVIMRHIAGLREQAASAAGAGVQVREEKDSGWLEVNVEDDDIVQLGKQPDPPATPPTPEGGRYEELLRTAIAGATGSAVESPEAAPHAPSQAFTALRPCPLPHRSGYAEVTELRLGGGASSWEGWHLAASTLHFLLATGLYKYHEVRREIDTEYRYPRLDRNETRVTSYLARPGGLSRLSVRLARLCLTYAPALPTLPIPEKYSVRYPEAMKGVLKAVRDIVAFDKRCDADRDRFGELETPQGGKRLELESKGRTLTLLNATAKHINRGGVAKYSDAVLPSVVDVFFGIIADRKSLLVAMLGAEGWKRLNARQGVRCDTLQHIKASFEVYVMAPDWHQLNQEMQPVVDLFDKEVHGLWTDIIKRREIVTRGTNQQCDALDRKNAEYLQIAARLAKLDPLPSTIVAHYRDLQRTADKFWRRMVASVTNERGSWANPKVEQQLVMRSWKEAGTELCRIRAKLRRDPTITDHSDITARADIGEGGKKLDAVKLTHKGDGAASAEEDEEETDADDALGGVDEVDEPPPLTESALKFSCEIVSLMQGWSGSLQIDVAASQQLRYLYVLVDEENTAFTQTINAASERLVEKPKDDKYAVDNLKQMTLRRYRMAWGAVEFFFVDGKSMLLNFMTKDNAVQVLKLLSTQIKPRPKNLKVTQLWTSAKMCERDLKTSKLQERWLNREISNFEYLMALNHYGSRTANDITQYPIMPWVLADYTSPTLNLADEAVYRDLGTPMGCLGKAGKKNPNRAEETVMKYESLAAMEQEPYHFGSHYSNSGFTLFYLIRLEPYTTGGIVLQGARFDHADRMFDSLHQTWHGVTHSSSDVKELIPEFFYLPEMFMNNNAVKFGTRQDGRALDHVELPPWAATPDDFVRIHREALESEHVSANLHKWIDLIWGAKQYGDEGRKAVNMFHPYTYEQTYRDLENDELQRNALINHIDNFGQCPVQLFSKRHPARTPLAPLFHPFKTSPETLVPQSTLHRVMQKPIVKISLFPAMEQLAAIGENGVVTIHKLKVLAPVQAGHDGLVSPKSKSKAIERKRHFTFDSTPMFQSRALQAGMQKCRASEYSYVIVNRPDTQFLFASGWWNNSATVSELVAMHAPPSVLQTLYEHSDVITCIAVSDDHSHVVTGSRDTTLSLWALRLNSTSQPLASLKATLFGHEDEVLCVAINHTADLIASGGGDGVALLYNVSEGRYERTLAHPQSMSVDLITIMPNGSTILYSRGDMALYLFSVNGRLLARAEVNVILNSLALTHDAKYVLCGGCPIRGQGAALFARSTHDLALVCNYHGAPAPIRSVAVHREHQVIAVGLEDGSLMFYSLHLQ
eukprot:TRINITY_DN16104_c0_g1_i1.p1 TRINITY_DN16104_c0_g1~~TRINITY_DN16104_c0_g1_i1.p1  ORF type:complete len:3447 (+),score=1235.46 TRINITY_DN16104_c0_g1_i1:166-10506(+)